jgi:hypothetical protein
MSPVRQQAPMLGSVFVSSPQVTRVLSKAIIGAAALLLVLAAAAHAGRYHAYSCRTPSGESAPVDGWSGSTSGVHFTYVENTCSQGGAMVAALGDQPAERQANADVATWALTVPSPETVVGATVWRAGDTAGGAMVNATYQFWLAGSSEFSVFDECLAVLACAGRGNPAVPLGSENRVVVPAPNLGPHLYMRASCGGISEYKCPIAVGDAQNYAAVAYLYAADLALEQNEGPSASNVSGPLTSEQPVRGTSDVIFSATDPGAGIYEAEFNVDGNVVQRTVINENGGHCHAVGGASDGLPAFLYLQPCLKSLTADVGFDSTKVSNGVHHLIVIVSDPAGNTATVLDRSVVVENELGSCNAACDGHASLHPGASDARLLRRTITRRYANSGLALTGQLLDHAGVPMNGAMIELRQQASYPGARNVLVATTTTDAKGGWKLRVPRGPSRLVTVGYRSRTNNPTFATQLQYRETVAAGVWLSAPRAARSGRPFAFRGKLAGGFIPRGGVLVSLEIFFGGEWREIALLRTNRRGAFAYRYTFAAIGPATYRFRAQLPHTIGYPFASGASKSSYIHLRR